MNYTLISNPLSGSYNKKIISKFIREITKYNIIIKEIVLKKNQPIKEIIENLEYQKRHCLIFACGDGTINSGINALNDRDDVSNFIMTIVPLGSANVFCKELNIKSYKDTIKLILNNNYKKICLAKAENIIDNTNKFFALMASVGYDSMAVNNLNERLKEKIGKIAYIISFFKVIFRKNEIKLEVKVNKQKYECCSVLIQNGKYYGGKFDIASTTLYKKELEIIIVKKLSFFSIVKYFFLKKSKNIFSIKSNNLIIESEEDIPIQIDGDKFSCTPIEITLTEKFINVLS